MSQVLRDEHITDILAVDRKIAAGPPVIAGHRPGSDRPARAIDDLQVDVVAQPGRASACSDGGILNRIRVRFVPVGD
jgi:hypothetical protein